MGGEDAVREGLSPSSGLICWIVNSTFTWWIYEFHIFELRDEEINVKAIIAVKCATYTAAKKRTWKHFEGCRHLDTELCDTDRCSALTNLASKPTKSRSLNWLVTDPGKIKTKWRICEFHIFELRDEEIIAKKIITINYATYALAERKSEKFRLAGIRTRTSAIHRERIAKLDLLVNHLPREGCCLSTEQQS